ncbi:MAG: glycosyl hydrolase, partial [Planctomycetota bacterium]
DPPDLFTDEWWDVYSRISLECGRLDMGIGLSTYTIDWPRGAKNLFWHLFYSKPELNAIQLEVGRRQRLRGGETKTVPCSDGQFAARAYRIENGKIQRGGVDLAPFIKADRTTWTAPDGDWEIWTFRAVRKGGSLNPLMTGSGDTVIRGFFQQFQDRNPGKTSKGLNYFFNDELHIGLGKFAWNPDFIREFRRRKGYDLLDVLPGMWVDIGDVTPKVRMDYADVRMSLMEERYFKPIHDWHASRGMIFACDSGGRGRNPHEFGDYFRATRWYTAPGHDTPGGRADLIKGKVSSSIANLYRRPRVWLEGYHSLGWGAAPERLMLATRENYLYGCTLLNLHGLYYTTYGSHWEWAPPCYHFRMPYWAHMDVFLGYFDRLSYLMSQEHHVCDVAVVYPVAPYEAEMNGRKSCGTAFNLGGRLMAAGINFEYVDNDSLARAEVEDGNLLVRAAGASYKALVFPNMEAVRWESIEKAARFAEAGGKVYAVGAIPAASDRAGRNDPELAAMNDRAFKTGCRLAQIGQVVGAVRDAFVQDVRGLGRTVRALHRKVGPRDVYLVMDASPGDVVEFRAKGAVELWDPWTGNVRPLRVVERTATGTRVELPLSSYEAQVVVFTPGTRHVDPPKSDERPMRQKTLPDEWIVAFVPTMDNTHGDFRMPVTAENRLIGVEARRFAWARETADLAGTAMLPATDDRSWSRKLHGYGTQFYLLGPVPNDVDAAKLDAELAGLRRVDPAIPVTVAGRTLRWRAYDFSWRYGKEGDLGHQGYHGLKRTVTDDFICLGKTRGGLNETRYTDEKGGRRYYLWTSATTPKALSATIH